MNHISPMPKPTSGGKRERNGVVRLEAVSDCRHEQHQPFRRLLRQRRVERGKGGQHGAGAKQRGQGRIERHAHEKEGERLQGEGYEKSQGQQMPVLAPGRDQDRQAVHSKDGEGRYRCGDPYAHGP